MITFDIRDRDHPKHNPKKATRFWRKVSRVGKVYAVNGEEIELFTMTVLSEALDREKELLLEWEKAGLLPRPIFQLPDKPLYRYYSATQIINMHRVFRYRYGGLKHLHIIRNGGKDLRKRFLADLKQVFYSGKVIVTEDGGILDE